MAPSKVQALQRQRRSMITWFCWLWSCRVDSWSVGRSTSSIRLTLLLLTLGILLIAFVDDGCIVVVVVKLTASHHEHQQLELILILILILIPLNHSHTLRDTNTIFHLPNTIYNNYMTLFSFTSSLTNTLTHTHSMLFICLIFK